VGDDNVGVSDIVMKTYGYVFHKVDIISILSKSALTHLLNVKYRKGAAVSTEIDITACTAK
jgi:hypothetical protein